MEQGIVHSVDIVTQGSYVAVAASSTDTELVLDEVLDFNEDGGTISLNGVEYAYTAADFETDTLTIPAGLSADAAEGDRVDVIPVSVEKHAKVVVAGSEDALTAVVPHALYDRITEGIRASEDMESVTLDLTTAGRFVITDVVGRRPVIDGAYIEPGTVASDGEPPTTSPTPVLTGTVGAILARWTPIENSSPVEYDVHVSTDPNFAPSDVYDDFSGTLAKWTIDAENPSGTVTIDAGRAKLLMPTPGGGHFVHMTSQTMDVTDRTIACGVEMTTLASADQIAVFDVSTVGWSAQWMWFGPDIFLAIDRNAVSTNGPTFPWNSVEHRHLRIRFDGPDVYWETSETGAVWTVQWQQAHGFPTSVLQALQIGFDLGDADIGSVDPAASMWVDNVIVAPADTQVVATAGSSTTIRTLNGQPLQYNTDYYVRIVARDADGPSLASPTATARMKQADNEDISAEYGYFGNIAVDQLVGGTLSADVALASKISTRGGGTGGGWDGDVTGISIYDSAGTPATILKSEGSNFTGDIEAGGLTVTKGLALRSTGVHEVSKGAALTLQSATTAAQSPPSAVVGWPDPIVAHQFSQGYGLVWADSQWNAVLDSDIPTIKRTVGADIPLGVDSSPRPWGGLTKIGTSWYTLGKHPTLDTYFITKYSSVGATDAQVTYTPIAGANGSGGSVAYGLAPAAIGTDGTNVLVAEFDDANNRFRIKTYNPTTLAETATLNTGSNAGFSGPVVGVRSGSFDLGATRFIILSKNGEHYWPFDSAGTYMPNEAWPTPQPGSMSGFDWDGTRFWGTRARHIAANAFIYKHTTHKWSGAGSVTWHTTPTWRDTDAGGTGTHETDMGQFTSFAMKKRAAVTLTSTTIPDSGGADDPNAVSFYLSNTTTARTSFWRQTLPADGVNTLTVGDGITFAGTNPPASNNFPGATAAQIRNAAGTLVVDGGGGYTGTSATLSGALTAGSATVGGVAVPKIATGNFLFGAVTTLQTQAISFPFTFGSTPIVVATPRTSADVTLHVAVSGESTTGFNLHFKRSTAVGTNVGWVAIGT